MKTCSVHGIELQFDRRNFYCGHGPVRPIYKKGWVVLKDGVVIAGNSTRFIGSMSSAKEPEFPTLDEAKAFDSAGEILRAIARAAR